MTLAATLRDRSDITFDLVLNAEPGEVDAFANRHAKASNVTTHSRTDDPASFYARADLVLNLARVDQWIETFGLTLVEAMTFGIPVIAPPVGGPAEIVTHGQEGYCIDSRDVPALPQRELGLRCFQSRRGGIHGPKSGTPTFDCLKGLLSLEHPVFCTL